MAGGSAEAISLTLSDNGIGFELSNTLSLDGIGLHSMRERARMLGGTFEVLSRPMHGTQIVVTVRLAPVAQPREMARSG